MRNRLSTISCLLAICLAVAGILPVAGSIALADAVDGVSISQKQAAGTTEEQAVSAGTVQANALVKPSTKNLTLEVNETKTITFTCGQVDYLSFSPDTSRYYDAFWGYWYEGGAKIDLTVTGKKVGNTTITITNGVNDEKLKIKITVKEESETSGKYRALLIGERTFKWWDGSEETIVRNVGDMKMMESMLGRIYTPSLTKYSVKTHVDATYNDVKSLIQSTFAGTKDDSVSLFFIATHGNNSGDGELAMAKGSKNLSFAKLASWLNTYVKGKVIVILESCGSGSAIYEKGIKENDKEAIINALKEEDRQAAAFTAAAVKAFAEADTGIAESNSTGDLRTPKFYVLTASRHHELSWGTEGGPYNFFTMWLVEGVGSISRSPADRNNNGKITLNELFNYIKFVGNNFGFDYEGQRYYQHVQRYPIGSSYVLFCTR